MDQCRWMSNVMYLFMVSRNNPSGEWWFYICETCIHEVSVIDDIYKYDCGKIGSYLDKRFKVPIYVTDPSETIQVFLFNREVRSLTSINLNSLIGPNIKEGKRDKYPEKLKGIAGKNLTLTISLTDMNLNHDNTIYFVSDVTEEDPTPSQISNLTSHHIDSVVISKSSKNDKEDTMETKPATNKRIRASDNGAYNKKKSAIM